MASITLTPQSRRANKARFNAKNPWAVGKTIAEIRVLVDGGEKLKGGFVLPEPKAPRASRSTKGGTPKGAKRANTVKSKRTKAERRASAKRREEFTKWLGETAEQRHARKKSNADMAAWLRESGVVPSGQAWDACKKGERSIKALKALNAADGKVFITAEKHQPKAKKAKKAPQVEVVAVVDETTRPRPHRADGSFMNATEAEFYWRMIDHAGLTVEQARAATATLV